MSSLRSPSSLGSPNSRFLIGVLIAPVGMSVPVVIAVIVVVVIVVLLVVLVVLVVLAAVVPHES